MNRRKLEFATLDDAVNEAHQLLRSGYQRAGNWSLAQACRHLRLTFDASIDGYPWWMSVAWPLRPIIRWLMLDRILRGDSPTGLKTAGMFVPPDNLEDREEFEAFSKSVERFKSHDGYLHPHPGFGKFKKEKLEQFHAAHSAHHFGFLIPKD